MRYIVAPQDESPYEDLRIFCVNNGQVVATLPLDDAPVADYNAAQRRRAFIIAKALTDAGEDP